MNVQRFLAHYGLTCNPFEAEEARQDPIFARHMQDVPAHPDFNKILGQVNPPTTSIVFGEKGSGKTAIRMMIARRISEHNRAHPQHQTLMVAYDDLDPVIESVMEHRKLKRRDRRGEMQLEEFRLEDHQDAILALAVTQIVDLVTSKGAEMGESIAPLEDLDDRLRRMPRPLRVDLAVLAALYDRPEGTTFASRWRSMWRRLRLQRTLPIPLARVLGTLFVMIAAVLVAGFYWSAQPPVWLPFAAGLSGAVGLVMLGSWVWRNFWLWRLCRRISRDTPVVDHTGRQLQRLLASFSAYVLSRQVWPVPAPDGDGRQNRYALTRRLLDVLKPLGFEGMVVMIDRVDEPRMVAGRADRMRSIIWPMFDNKFLQQDGVGFKMLLPIELRHMLRKESADFFQEARLDKQNLIDPLDWSGATLYDLCAHRLRACSESEDRDSLSLTDLFDSDVTRETVVDALDQMHQPRDAFKFLYAVIQEHCKMIPEDQARYKIARLTVETVRRRQSQRVQDFYRGLAPA